MTRNKSRTKPDPEFDCEGQVDVEATIEEREYASGPPTSYVAPGSMEWWRYLRAVTLLPLRARSDLAVLGCLLDHANPTTGQCYPCQQLISNETGLDLRTVERAIVRLVGTPYLSKERRGCSSNAYHVNWKALEAVDAEYQERRRINSRRWTDKGVGTEDPRNVPVPSRTTGSTPSQVSVQDPSKVWGKKENLQKENIKRKHEVADCASRNTADVIPLEGKSATKREHSLRTQYASSALPEEEGITQLPNSLAAEKAVRLAISIHPKIEVLEAAFDADAELYFEAIREETARTSGGCIPMDDCKGTAQSGGGGGVGAGSEAGNIEMPRPRMRACLEQGLKLDINKLRRSSPALIVGPNLVRWWSAYWDEEIARAQISASMARDYEGWFRIQLGSLNQTNILVRKSRHFGGGQ